MTNHPIVVPGTKQELCKFEMKYREERKRTEVGRGNGEGGY